MNVNELSDLHDAEILWDYCQLRQPCLKADFIFLLCSYNLDVADHAYGLYQKGMGDKIAISGGLAHQDDLLNTGWDKPEAVIFQARLLELGLDKEHIIIEDKATNTGENMKFTKDILSHKMPHAKSGLIVQKPYMERRAYASAMKQWPEMSWSVTSPDISYTDYANKHGASRLINLMVGDTWRIKDYANKGYQIPQDMPKAVEKALEKLMDRGYTKHITK